MQVTFPLFLALALTACCPAPVPVPTSLAEPAPEPRPAPPAVSPAVPARLKADSAAVQQHAKQFVARPSTPPGKLAELEPLTRNVNQALAVMELHHRRSGAYRPADVRAARAAADAVARFLDAQPPPREAAEPASAAPAPAANPAGFGEAPDAKDSL